MEQKHRYTINKNCQVGGFEPNQLAQPAQLTLDIMLSQIIFYCFVTIKIVRLLRGSHSIPHKFKGCPQLFIRIFRGGGAEHRQGVPPPTLAQV